MTVDIEKMLNEFGTAIESGSIDEAFDARIKISKAFKKLNKIIPIAKRISKEFREWHKPGYGDLPHNDLLTALHDLDGLFPGVKAGEDEEEDVETE